MGKHLEGCPHISVTQGEMFVDNFSSVDHAIEVTRNNVDLTKI